MEFPPQICANRWILLPGLDGTGLLFEPMKAAAPKNTSATVVCYPRRTPQTYENLLQLVSGSLPRYAPYILIAESFSGPIAIQAASLAQVQPQALILCATFATCPLGPISTLVVKWSSAFLFRVRPPQWFVRRYLLGGDAPKKLIEDFYRALGSVAVPVLQARLDSVLQINVLSRLAGLRIPVLYIHGAKDRLLGKTSLRAIRRACPNVEIATVNAPHLMLQREPEQCFELINRFIVRIGQTP